MKYTGTTNIYDENGEIIYTRELTSDEMMDAILSEKKLEKDLDSAIGAMSEEVPGPTPGKRPYKKRGTTEKLPTTYRKAGENVRECCGSKSRHYKWCKEIGGSGEDPGKDTRRRTVEGRLTFSEATYDSVRKMLEVETVDYTSATKGLDLTEVRRVNLANDYQDYLKIA